jgi:hypothetical protein
MVHVGTTEHVAQIPLDRGVPIGLDLGSAQAIIFSDGTVIDLRHSNLRPKPEGLNCEKATQSGQVAGRSAQ